MSSTSKRIVLVDPLGDVLFSGESMIAKEAVKATAAAADQCPETKRSAESGTFRAVSPPIVTDAVDPDASASQSSEPATQKRGGRAA